ncbi:hypothetical protein [Niveispirillum irakense]|uniref:hypothetical protein n=1 Tax=Niveispirillum irakense TaxID=34011 RepID=UPI0003FC1264|nr:hypothetical protein [Niveispirillum irakense]
MAYALDHEEDALPPVPTRAAVEADIAEWQARVAHLLKTVEAWISQDGGFQVLHGSKTVFERRMQMVGITEPYDVPILSIERDGRGLVLFPEYRWVTGTRGQLVLSDGDRLHCVADGGTADAPDWVLIRDGSIHLEPFTREVFLQLLEAME